MVSDVPPTPTLPRSNEQCIPVDRTKKMSMTQEAETQRKERSFRECIEFLMPVYLLPFLLGNKGTCIYAVLLTVVGLMGRLLPSPVAAMLPIVVLSLGGVRSVEMLAAHYLGPQVLSACLLFALAITGDETTIFLRLCLHALKRYALRMQPLFGGMQCAIFGLSLIMPSSFVMAFSTIFIERFVTTVRNEIVVTDQRSALAIHTSSNHFDGGRRPRWGRKASTGAFGRGAGRMSLSDPCSLDSEVSGGSSAVKPYKRQPTFSGLEQLDEKSGERKAQKEFRKTSFGVLDGPPYDDDRPPHLPVRRVRSFSAEHRQPFSILKRSAEPVHPPLPRHTPLSKTLPWASHSVSPFVTGTEDRSGTLPTEDTFTAAAQYGPRAEERHDILGEAPVSTMKTMGSLAVASASITKTMTTPSSTSVTIPDTCYSRAPDSSLANFTSRVKSRSGAARTETSSSTIEWTGNGSSRKSQAKAGSRNRDQEAGAFPSICEDHAEAANQLQKNLTYSADHLQQLAQQSSGSEIATEHEERRTSTQSRQRLPDASTVAMAGGVVERKPSLKLELETKRDPKPEANTKPEPDSRLEVRSVLKKRCASLQPRTSGSAGSVPGWNPWQPCGNDEGDIDTYDGFPRTASMFNFTSGKNPIAWRSSASESNALVERGSSLYFTGAEPVTSSLRVRGLTMSAHPAFIAGAAYTAIFGNMANFSTLPTRSTVLVALGCGSSECPVNWWSWLAVSLPVALACCIVTWTSIYCASLASCDDDIDEQAHEDMAKSARVRHHNMKRPTILETLTFYWLIGIPAAASAFSLRHQGWHLELPFLALTFLLLSLAPGSLWRRWWWRRMLNWHTLSSRMPWNIILMLGSVTALTRTVEDYRLVESGLAKLEDEFWAQRSTKSSQFILVIVAAVLSELLVGESVARSMVTTVVRVAVVTESPVSFFVVPVSLVASMNVILPVSLPLLVMREYGHTNSVHMVAYGLFLKCVAVTAMIISMNTVGLAVFQGSSLPKGQGMALLHNITAI